MEALQAEIMAGEHTDKRYLDVADNILSHIKAEPENMKHYTAL